MALHYMYCVSGDEELLTKCVTDNENDTKHDTWKTYREKSLVPPIFMYSEVVYKHKVGEVQSYACTE